jgi:hypothetical protein
VVYLPITTSDTKSEGIEKLPHPIGNQKKAGVAVLK